MEKQVLLGLLKKATNTNTQADANAFANQLWTTYHDFIYAKIVYMLGNDYQQYADDVMITFFEKKIFKKKNLKNFPTDSITAFEKVLYRAVHNHCLDCLNKQNKDTRRFTELDENLDQLTIGDTTAQKDSIIAKFKACIKLLSFKQQALFWLRAANISYGRLALIHHSTERAMILRFARIKEALVKGNLDESLTQRDKAKIEKFLNMIDNETVKSFVSDLIFSKKGLTEIITELEKNGEKSHIVVLRSIVYFKQYLHKAA